MLDPERIASSCSFCDWTSDDQPDNDLGARTTQEQLVRHHVEDHLDQAHGLATVPDGYEWMVWDPREWHGLTIERDLPGFIVVSGNRATTLRDDSRDRLHLPDFGRVERQVLITRLRAWADELDEPRVEVRTASGDTISTH